MCDSSAAMGVAERKGVGKIRHLDVGKLWIQEMRESGGVEVKKVKGTANPADQLTKNLMPQEVEKGLELCGMEARAGRSEKAMEVKSEENTPEEKGLKDYSTCKADDADKAKTQRRRKRKERERDSTPLEGTKKEDSKEGNKDARERGYTPLWKSEEDEKEDEEEKDEREEEEEDMDQNMYNN